MLCKRVKVNMMDPDLLARRRTTVFQKIQLEFTQGDVIRKKLSPGKFPTSSIGMVKLLAMVSFRRTLQAGLNAMKCYIFIIKYDSKSFYQLSLS